MLLSALTTLSRSSVRPLMSAALTRPSMVVPASRYSLHICLSGSDPTERLVWRPFVRARSVRMLSGEPDRAVVEVCADKLKAALDPRDVKVEGAYDDPNGSHITIYCVSVRSFPP